MYFVHDGISKKTQGLYYTTRKDETMNRLSLNTGMINTKLIAGSNVGNAGKVGNVQIQPAKEEGNAKIKAVWGHSKVNLAIERGEFKDGDVSVWCDEDGKTVKLFRWHYDTEKDEWCKVEIGKGDLSNSDFDPDRGDF